MIVALDKADAQHGRVAEATAKLPSAANPVPGFILGPEAMRRTLDERAEQVANLLRVRTNENAQRVAADLKRTILTLHVPKVVEDEIEKEFDLLRKPVVMQLSPVGAVASPLEPAIILGVHDKKAVLDGLRMLYAEMHTAENLATEDDDRSAAVIMQSMPAASQTFRVIPYGSYTFVEASDGYSAWAGYAEPDRFLFEGDTLTREERGDEHGVFWEHDQIVQRKRGHVGADGAKAALAFCRPTLGAHPLLVAKTADGFVTLGALAPLPAPKA